jgi:hypothetical protein
MVHHCLPYSLSAWHCEIGREIPTSRWTQAQQSEPGRFFSKPLDLQVQRQHTKSISEVEVEAIDVDLLFGASKATFYSILNFPWHIAYNSGFKNSITMNHGRRAQFHVGAPYPWANDTNQNNSHKLDKATDE